MTAALSQQDMINFLKGLLTEKSLDHSIRVKNEAKRLAKLFGQDGLKAETAGLLHDLAKDMMPSKLLSEAERLGLKVGDFERLNPELLHGAVGAAIAASKLKLVDGEVLSAIASHTIGDVPMNPLDMLIYIADKIEPDRSHEGAELIRSFDGKDLLAAFKMAYGQSIKNLIKMDKQVHPRSFEVWDWLQSSKREISSPDRE